MEPEYLSPAGLAERLGHSERFWRAALDGKRVRGHRVGGRKDARTGKVVGGRMILVSSARAYLEGLDGGVVSGGKREAKVAAGVGMELCRAFAREQRRKCAVAGRE